MRYHRIIQNTNSLNTCYIVRDVWTHSTSNLCWQKPACTQPIQPMPQPCCYVFFPEVSRLEPARMTECYQDNNKPMCSTSLVFDRHTHKKKALKWKAMRTKTGHCLTSHHFYLPFSTSFMLFFVCLLLLLFPFYFVAKFVGAAAAFLLVGSRCHLFSFTWVTLLCRSGTRPIRALDPRPRGKAQHGLQTTGFWGRRWTQMYAGCMLDVNVK